MPGVRRIAVTCGEPAGIGPDIVLALAHHTWPAQLVIHGDPQLLEARARQLGETVELDVFTDAPPQPSPRGRLLVAPTALAVPASAGRLDRRNASHVLGLLETAFDGCRHGTYAAMVTAPVHKGIINEAGIPFTGHTEFLATRAGGMRPVMLLVSDRLRVALVTTHLPLAAVPAAITRERIDETLRILHDGLQRQFGLAQPHIAVLGLNPHAGEDGHLGNEEQAHIIPVLDVLRRQGMRLTGPLSADTAFVARHLAGVDAILAMYHDQGLPVLKQHGFGHAVNVTLGLPIVRTSVDHGTALALAGSGRAESGSLHAAVRLACEIAARTST